MILSNFGKFSLFLQHELSEWMVSVSGWAIFENIRRLLHVVVRYDPDRVPFGSIQRSFIGWVIFCLADPDVIWSSRQTSRSWLMQIL